MHNKVKIGATAPIFVGEIEMPAILKYSLIILGVIVVMFVLTRFGVFSGKRPVDLGVTLGKLATCPETPNCVSTQADDELHSISPLIINGTTQQAQDMLLSIVEDMPRTNVVVNDPGYIYVEFHTGIMRYTDDVEFWFDESTGVIQFRSASRLGSGDFGLNRRRMEQIRQQYNGYQRQE